MEVQLRYHRRSRVEQGPYRSTISLAPNLARERVFFDAELRDPLRLREALSALHEVVVSDLRFRRRDKSAYEAWKKRQSEATATLTRELLDASRVAAARELVGRALPPDLEALHAEKSRRYWGARATLARALLRDDPALFRALAPLDPVITVAPDVVFLEAFSRDESSYGCLYVDRESFVGAQEASLGTTNVDYSMALFERLQGLRTYRTTRFSIDPSGFDVDVEGRPEHREEKVELPASWLRGFGQISAVSDLATRDVPLEVSALYSILAFLGRHREKTGPRALVFELRPGKPTTIVIEPWGQRVEVRGSVYEGPKEEDVKVWGRRRLFALARLLPMIEGLEVRLVGTGLPSVWIAKMGELRFVLALSGWTANDWANSANLDLLAGTLLSDDAIVHDAARLLQVERSASARALAERLGVDERRLKGSLHRLAREGQITFDPVLGVHRFRQVLDPRALRHPLEEEPIELAKGKELYLGARVALERSDAIAGNKRWLSAKIAGERVEAIVDGDGLMTRARCSCHHFHVNGLRAGPCRHLLALRLTAFGGAELRLQAGSLGGGFIH